LFALACKTKVTAYFYLIYTFFRVSLPCTNTGIYYRTRRPATDRGLCGVWWSQRQRGVVFT